MLAFSGNTVSTKNGILRSIKSSIKKEVNYFTQLWVEQVNDFRKPKNLFPEYSKELSY